MTILAPRRAADAGKLGREMRAGRHRATGGPPGSRPTRSSSSTAAPPPSCTARATGPPTTSASGARGALRPRARRRCSTCTAATPTPAATSSPRTRWGAADRAARRRRGCWETTGRVHWMDVARRGVRLARAGDRPRPAAPATCAVAFALNGDVDRPEGAETIRLLARAFEEEPPDLILLETLSLVRAVDSTRRSRRCSSTGLPVWLSFRRCRHGVCGVYGQHWGGPEGDAFGRAARRFEEMGVGGAAGQLHPARPRRPGWSPGCATSPTCRSASTPTSATSPTTAGASTGAIGGDEYARAGARAGARRARRSSAAAAASAPSTSPRARERSPARSPGRRPPGAPPTTPTLGDAPRRRRPAPWRDDRGRDALPAAVPRPRRRRRASSCPPRAASWSGSTCSSEGIGAHQRCLDVGCGTGLLDGAARAQRRRARARDRHRRSAPSPTRSTTRSATASPTASAAPRSTSTRGCRRSATT